MVKLYYISVLYKQENNKVVTLKYASDLSSFGFFQRNSVLEFMRFTSKVVVERSELATRASVKEQEYLCHVFVRSDRLSGVIVSDHEYPHRVAHTLMSRILDDFSDKVASHLWPSIVENGANFIGLDVYLNQFQNPREADAMSKIQADLDETKIILHNTITSLLQRGEKLDDLVAKSEDLSSQSKVFYKTARKTNQCCQYL